MKLTLLISLFSFFICFSIIGQDLPLAEELLAKSINYHDPKGVLEKMPVELHMTESRPNGTKKKAFFHHNPKLATSYISRIYGQTKIGMVNQNGSIQFVVDDKYKPTDKQIEEYKLSNDYVKRMENYYQYLWYLPGKLYDYGTIVHDQVTLKDFFGQELLEIKVTYEETVGDDTWYFYFDPSSYALAGYRFYHDESKNDGEYILLEGEVQEGTLKIPKSRKWYTHKEDKYLGMDRLDQITIHEKKKTVVLPEKLFSIE